MSNPFNKTQTELKQQLAKARQNHKQLQKRLQWLPGLILPIYEIQLYNNRVIVRYRDQSGQQQTIDYIATKPFSNTRTIVADFHAIYEAIQAALAKIAIPWYGIKGLAIVDVRETLAGGLTTIEAKAILEAVHVAAKNKITKIFVTYQQDTVF
jgi:hypothetical protein